MKHAIAALFLTLILVLAPVGLFSATQSQAEQPKAAEPVVNCSQVRINPTQVRITCSAAGVQVLSTVIDLPKVTVTDIVQLPGERITIQIPGPTRTVQVPGGNSTVTKTATITEPPRTVTVRPQEQSRATATVTERRTRTVSPSEQDTRQASPEGGTLATGDPRPDDGGLPDIDLTTPEAVGIGFITLIVLVALILLGMWSGYYMGYKDSDKAEAKFIKSLLRKK